MASAIREPSSDMPVLLDCTSTPVRVSRSSPWYSLSLTFAPPATSR